MDYGQYLDQITYLLFLQMWERDKDSGQWWASLRNAEADELLGVYEALLIELGRQEGFVGDIFTGARAEFGSPVSLARLIQLIDGIHWAELDRDIQADAFEYLLERAAAEGKKGAGQYFTPRVLMRAIVRCIDPGSRSSDTLVADPAAGTGGFLLAAQEHVKHKGASNNIRFWGNELVQRPRRLALMNAILHETNLESIDLGDALKSPMRLRPNVILANPPFGSQGGSVPARSDFWFRTANKQANFLQHIILGMASDGRAAVVVPDNCFFGDTARGLLPELLRRVNLHTVLRLPDGTFSPYTSGTKTNVMFFNAGEETKTLRIYDARTQRDRPRRPVSEEELASFVDGFTDPTVGHRPELMDESRWSQFSHANVSEVDYEIDRLPWKILFQHPEQPAWTSLMTEASKKIRAANDEVEKLIQMMANPS